MGIGEGDGLELGVTDGEMGLEPPLTPCPRWWVLEGTRWPMGWVLRGLLGGAEVELWGSGGVVGLCVPQTLVTTPLSPPPRMTILPPTEKLKVLLEKLSSFYTKFVKEFS